MLQQSQALVSVIHPLGGAMQFLLFLIIDGILKRVSKTVHTLVRRCPRKPWILQRLPSGPSEEKQKKIFQALAWIIMASQQASAQEAKAGSDPDLDGSVGKETGSKERLQNSVSRSRR